MTTTIDCIALTRRLVGFNTINPPGDEAACAEYLAQVLASCDVATEVVQFGPARANLLARIAGRDPTQAPLVLTGHLDTVPLGTAKWSTPPFAAEVIDGRLYGRGASDMKSGVAAMTAAFARAYARKVRPMRGVTLLLTGGEEVGCQGALHLHQKAPALLGTASAMLVGEPTGNQLVCGHKGALFVRARASGITAHSSTPERGVNAIYKAARAITRLERLKLPVSEDAFMGSPTLNVGMISGGLNANSVPDQAEFTVDVRAGSDITHAALLAALSAEAEAEDVQLQPFIDMPAVFTPKDDPFTNAVAAATRAVLGERASIAARAMPFFSDASVFQPHYACPTIILGPGEPQAAHETDEYCRVDKIREAEEIYLRVIESWCGG
jgi:succinyl-diaminopimelate desuccinylase